MKKIKKEIKTPTIPRDNVPGDIVFEVISGLYPYDLDDETSDATLTIRNSLSPTIGIRHLAMEMQKQIRRELCLHCRWHCLKSLLVFLVFAKRLLWCQ